MSRPARKTVKDEHREARKATRKATVERRKSMRAKAFSFQIDASKLSAKRAELLQGMRDEARWLYNHLVEWCSKSFMDDFGFIVYPNNLYEWDHRTRDIEVLEWVDGRRGEHLHYSLRHLGSHMIQDIAERMKRSLRSMAARRAANPGSKFGSLKFKTNVNIPLRELGNTFRIQRGAGRLSRLLLQGCGKERFHLMKNRAFSQFVERNGFAPGASFEEMAEAGALELSNAEIQFEGSKARLVCTCYLSRESLEKSGLFRTRLDEADRIAMERTDIGVDAGIAKEMALNVGEIFEGIAVDTRDTPRKIKLRNKIAHSQRKLDRHKNKHRGPHGKLSRKQWALKSKHRAHSQKLSCVKDDEAARFLSLLRTARSVSFQDEQIKNWHQSGLNGFGRRVQNGILGRVWSVLRSEAAQDPEKRVMLRKHAPTTKRCVCGQLNPMPLEKRAYGCPVCGYQNHRDLHASHNMLLAACAPDPQRHAGWGTHPKAGPGSCPTPSNPGQQRAPAGWTNRVHSIFARKLDAQSRSMEASRLSSRPIPEAPAFRQG